MVMRLSVTEGPLALTLTGFIWVRYSLVITPVNYSLAAVRLPLSSSQNSHSTPFFNQVNFFVGLSGLTQLGRLAQYVSYHLFRDHLPLTGCI